MYLTIGNIPKELRRKPSQRTHVLLGYLPTTRMLDVSNTASRRRRLANLFHHCLSHILSPLIPLAETGIEMTAGDGVTRRTVPLLTCFIGDYPEQVLVAGCKTGECPKCDIKWNQIGNLQTEAPYRDLGKVLDALSTLDENPDGYPAACAAAGIKPIVRPFWQNLPYADIYFSITPDILHQLYQGVMKHLVSWVIAAFGEKEIDARCRCLPPNHNIHYFSKGISSLSQLTGKEHANMCCILLGLIVDLKLPGNQSPLPLICAVRALLDFLYLAQYPLHTSETLRLLRESLKLFDKNKHIFIDLGIRSDFNIPKLHSLVHYVDAIKLFGSTDNYNTEYTERLHIDLAKDAYRATNHRDEYAQMTVWLERMEKVHRHHSYLEWRAGRQPKIVMRSMSMSYNGTLSLAKWPSVKAVKLDDVVDKYGATFFREAVLRYIALSKPSGSQLTLHQLEQQILYTSLPFTAVPIYHKLKFIALTESSQNQYVTLDAIHARPERRSKKGTKLRSRFDVALLEVGPGTETSVQSMFGLFASFHICSMINASKGYRVGQVRVVFALPGGPGDNRTPERLAYVEWFSNFTTPDPHHEMYKINRSLEDGQRVASVVPISTIKRSVHFFPRFGSAVPDSWTVDNVLEKCSTFYLNPFTDRHMYYIL